MNKHSRIKSDFEEIVNMARDIIAEVNYYKEGEDSYLTSTRINFIEERAKDIVGITSSMQVERGESEEGLK